MSADDASRARRHRGLVIRTGVVVAVLHAPDGFDAALTFPEGAVVQHGVRKDERVDVLLGFVTTRDHLARNIGWLVGTLQPGGAFWVAWPERAPESTDLTRDVIRDVARPVGLVDVSKCELDGPWSALRLVRRSEAEDPTDA